MNRLVKIPPASWIRHYIPSTVYCIGLLFNLTAISCCFLSPCLSYTSTWLSQPPTCTAEWQWEVTNKRCEIIWRSCMSACNHNNKQYIVLHNNMLSTIQFVEWLRVIKVHIALNYKSSAQDSCQYLGFIISKIKIPYFLFTEILWTFWGTLLSLKNFLSIIKLISCRYYMTIYWIIIY